eukprot:TRINITY_DN15_c0_g2_i1.p2 TRINITY_DN15_c0_g2~~TRINITY_DN15_c0_g2_i1.p2  ORF type:complete len:219 (+),score=70.64 TRINITY_DN15_c0_g2_i1:30-659(+)
MNTAALVFALLFAVVFAAPSPCCTPNQWNGKQVSWDPYRFVRREVTINYDYTNQRERFDVQDYHGAPVVYSILILYQSNTMYTFNTTSCAKTSLTTPMRQFCVPSNATYAGTITIGETSANVWQEVYGDYRIDTIHTNDASCIPINIVAVDAARFDVDFNEFWNVQASVNPAVFTVPPACSSDIVQMGDSLTLNHKVPSIGALNVHRKN